VSGPTLLVFGATLLIIEFWTSHEASWAAPSPLSNAKVDYKNIKVDSEVDYVVDSQAPRHAGAWTLWPLPGICAFTRGRSRRRSPARDLLSRSASTPDVQSPSRGAINTLRGVPIRPPVR
jgi:hypothetical protein